ncbi:uncharacterized protein LOC123551645 [Mercenaria mercenaria]|uniref:uncharacterized protein LOC123551645 n=1 Tax=Mercenaria mercenaria TaxID=6596 RepID=UPI00234EE144|nr:uncharacterized protein LOC123551645 [Mercenaria mercenaria]
MKITYVLALVLVFAVVAMAAKPNKAERKALRKCKPYTFSYTECAKGNMTITKNPTAGVDGCQPETYEKPCVEENTFTSKKNGCVMTKKIDRTACGVPGSDPETTEFTITLTKTGCTNSKKNKETTKTGLCKTGVKPKGGKGGKRGKGGKGGKGGKRKGNRREKKTQNQ